MSLRFNNKNVQENVKVNTADRYYMCITDGIGGILQEMDLLQLRFTEFKYYRKHQALKQENKQNSNLKVNDFGHNIIPRALLLLYCTSGMHYSIKINSISYITDLTETITSSRCYSL